MMRARYTILALAMAAALGWATVGIAADTPAKDPLIGTWSLNLAKSTYAKGQPPKDSTRTFDYTRDGLILVTLHNVPAQGPEFFAHWYLSLDGKDYPEFQRAIGAQPSLWIQITPIDAYTKELVGRKLENGVMTITDRFTLKVSPDAKILTVTYEDADGKPSGNVVVYDKRF